MESQSSANRRWLLAALLAAILLSVALLGGLGIGVVDAQENESNESNESEDDGFGADPNEGGNVSIEFGGDSEEVVTEEDENTSNESNSEDDNISAASEFEDIRDEGLSRIRGGAEEHIPGAETVGNIYDGARAAEDAITGGASGMGPSAGEWIHSGVTYVASALLSELIVVINQIHEIAVQVPAPGEATEPSTWSEPEEERWQTVFAVISWPIVIGVMWLITQFGISFSYESAEKRRRGWKRVALAGIMVFGTFVFAPALLHLFAELAADVYPDGEQFASPEGGVQFGLGVFLLMGLLVFKGIVVVAALVAVIALHFLTYISVLFWPLSWAAWASHGQARAYGSFGLFVFGSLLALSIIQSIILRFLIFLPLGESIGGTAGSIVLIIFGLGFALVYLPWKMLEKAQIAAALKLGREPTERAMQRAPKEVKNITRKFRDVGRSQTTVYHGSRRGRGGGSPRSGGGSTTSSGRDGSRSGGGGSSSSKRSGGSSKATNDSGSTRKANKQPNIDKMERERVRRKVNGETH